MSSSQKNQQIKQLTQELLDRLTNAAEAEGGSPTRTFDEMEQQSRHESDTSSLADEKEIHNKLTQILNLINYSPENPDNMEQEDIVRSEEEFTQRMVEEIVDESTGEVGNMEELDLYQIQVDDDLDDGDNQLDVEEEMQKLAQDYFLNEEESEEEEKKGDEISEEELQRLERAL